MSMFLEEIKIKKKLSVAIVAAIAAVVVLIFGIFGFIFLKDKLVALRTERQAEKERQIFYDVLDLSDLAVKQKDCQTAIEKASRLIEKNPETAEVWRWKGICEFETKNYKEAKKSFEKVLTLEPENKAVLNYLKSIDNIISGRAIALDPERDFLTREFVESKIGFSLDPKIYKFENAMRVPLSDSSVLRFSAEFSSKQSFEVAVQSIAKLLRQNNIEFEDRTNQEATKIEGSAAYKIKLSGDENMFRGYNIQIFDRSPVAVSVFYYEN